jgi:hypothetical protein
MKAIIKSFLSWFLSTRSTIINLFLIGILFQTYLVCHKKFFYPLIKILFVALAAQLICGFVKTAGKQKFIIVIILFVIFLRLPFYFFPDGMITMSDNALEALQCQEIQKNNLVPFFLLEAIRHEGTWKYLGIAYLWDFFGENYLYYLFLQLVIFLYLMWLLYKIFKPLAEKKALLGLIFLNFVFIELLFDYSLSIRGATYLEMLMLLAFGFYVFDFEFVDKVKIFLSYYFVFFAIYIHPLAAFLAASFAFCTFIYSLKKRKFLFNFILTAAGFLAGCFHLFYYHFFFKAKPPLAELTEIVQLGPFSSLSLRSLVELAKSFIAIFWNIFRFQFYFPVNYYPKGNFGSVLSCLNQAVVYFSLIIFVVAIVLSFQKTLRLLLHNEDLNTQSWPFPFFLVLLFMVIIKLLLLRPFRPEPRHNFDLLLLIIFSYLFVFPLLRIKKFFSPKAVLSCLLLLAFASPHYISFLRMAHHKQGSYRALMRALEKNKVRYLTADFGIAYTIHFLSGGKILVSDSLGPLTVQNFWRYSPEMIKEVDQASVSEKAYLFEAEDTPSRPWHKSATIKIKSQVLESLKKDGLGYKTIKLTDYTLIIPKKKKTSGP